MESKPWHYRDGAIELVGELYSPVTPANGRAVLVVHEADGIGGNVRRHCALLAKAGYFAAAADMHGGGRVLGAAEIPDALSRFRDDPELVRGRVYAALQAMCRDAGVAPQAAAAIGYCFGGFAVLELARSGAHLAAVASFHGLLTTRAPAAEHAINARVLACTGARDPLVPQDDLAAFQAEMIAAKADWHLLVHGPALHSYTNADVDKLDDSRMAYHEPSAGLSWTMLEAFLDQSFG